ncbi:MAG: phosphoribosylformylglycinamidine cyclo-ligase [Gemmatimonadetes bacterium]|nr:phosphoribosylformylglycinamidine cyclo-ligase [Gemmatimonadota bacterium]
MSEGTSRDAGSEAPAYGAAGVRLEAAERVKRRFGDLVRSTSGPEVLGGLGGFGGCFAIGRAPEADPVLVASADGVGTKILVARSAGVHHTVGQDLVNHCVNDLLASGARPLFFLDYIAAGRLDEEVAVALVEGFARGCRDNGLALLGGETAEMPDLYEPEAYDLAGFVVGVAPRARLERWNRCAEPDDVVLGLASSGLHTNGYTLARKTVQAAGVRLDEETPWGGETWSEALLAIHRSYLPAVAPLLDDEALRGAAHVTGGGFEGNLPRALPDGVGALLDRGAWDEPPLFRWISREGGVSIDEMSRVFNLGIGFCLVVAPEAADRIAAGCAEAGHSARRIGNIVAGSGVQWA